jgi:DNA invertase Pin-like site-specific DNA recombinase
LYLEHQIALVLTLRLRYESAETEMRRLTNGPGQAVAKKKRHSRAEIATKLAQANDLSTQGKLQSEIARTLGVSVMTLHRWRKAPPGLRLHSSRPVSPIGRAADATELLSSSSKIHGCGD